jgi:hypothetical protein
MKRSKMDVWTAKAAKIRTLPPEGACIPVKQFTVKAHWRKHPRGQYVDPKLQAAVLLAIAAMFKGAGITPLKRRRAA